LEQLGCSSFRLSLNANFIWLLSKYRVCGISFLIKSQSPEKTKLQISAHPWLTYLKINSIELKIRNFVPQFFVPNWLKFISTENLVSKFSFKCIYLKNAPTIGPQHNFLNVIQEDLRVKLNWTAQNWFPTLGNVTRRHFFFLHGLHIQGS